MQFYNVRRRLLSIAALGLSLLSTTAIGGKIDPVFADEAVPWSDENDQPVRLRDSLGHGSVILTMAYTSCQRTCPMTFQRLKQIEAKMTASNRPVTFLIVSLDPAHDDASKRREALSKHGSGRSTWHYLSGGQRQTDELAKVLGVDPVALANHLYHKMKITMYDSDGQFVKSIEPGDY